jgi:hypothetical protein
MLRMNATWLSWFCGPADLEGKSVRRGSASHSPGSPWRTIHARSDRSRSRLEEKNWRGLEAFAIGDNSGRNVSSLLGTLDHDGAHGPLSPVRTGPPRRRTSATAASSDSTWPYALCCDGRYIDPFCNHSWRLRTTIMPGSAERYCPLGQYDSAAPDADLTRPIQRRLLTSAAIADVNFFRRHAESVLRSQRCSGSVSCVAHHRENIEFD